MTSIELHESRSFHIGDNHYYISPSAILALPHVQSLPTGFSGLATVVTTATLRSCPLQDLVQYWSKIDDVYDLGFASFVIVLRSSSEPWTCPETFAGLILNADGYQSAPPEGPYYVRDNKIYPVWRIYTDTQDAFNLAIQPQSEPDLGFVPLGYVDELAQRMIAVPSRVPWLRDEESQLGGLRISVKDSIDLKGLRTGLSSKAWQSFYPAKFETASLVKNLMREGATVIGKTKLSSFGVLEYPMEWVDHHCPFNPRGDGHLAPGGSTSGGAAALAAFGWLDVSIGTDTAGSTRNPAAKSGLFAFRPTTHAFEMDGIFPLASALDAPGFLARDLGTLIRVLKVGLPKQLPIQRLCPKRIHVLEGYLPTTCEKFAAKTLFDDFVRDLAEYTEVEESHATLHKMFHADPPPGEDPVENPEVDYIQLLIDAAAVDKVKHFELSKRLEQFQAEYRQEHDRNPSFNPVIQDLLQRGRETDQEDYEGAVALMEVIQEWMQSKMQDSIAVIPLSEAEPSYRDEYIENPATYPLSSTVPRSFISPLSGCPEVVLPIAQLPYQSRDSGREEQLPLVVAIIGPPGSDLALVQFAADFLKSTGRSLSVKTGRLCFDLADPTGAPSRPRGAVRPQHEARSFDPLDLMEIFQLMEEPLDLILPGHNHLPQPNHDHTPLSETSMVILPEAGHGLSDTDELFSGDEIFAEPEQDLRHSDDLFRV